MLVPEEGSPYVVAVGTAEALAAELSKLIGTYTQVFIFHGVQWFISKGPMHRYLMGPNGERLPLFSNEPNLDIDFDGGLWTKPPR